MKVMKFGGGCFKSPGDMSIVTDIIKSQKQKTAVVVSALYGVTDMILQGIESAKKNENSMAGIANSLVKLHDGFLNSLIKNRQNRARVRGEIKDTIEEIEKILRGISYTRKVTDTLISFILSTGERLSSLLLAAVLEDRGLKAVPAFSEEIGLVTDNVFNNATALLVPVEKNLKKTVIPLLKKGIVPVITGYYGVNQSGKVTTFGRNGSDYSAAIIASGVKADVLELWKDVEGFMSADPAIVDGVIKIDSLSYDEAAELSYFGAKLIHPRSIEPVLKKGIPVLILHIHNPHCPPTAIVPGGAPGKGIVKSVACNQQIAVIGVHGFGVGYKPGIIAKIGDKLSSCRINIYTIITSQACINLIIDKDDAHRAMDELKEIKENAFERVVLKDGLALVAVVGEGLMSRKGVASSVFSALSGERINIEMISAGASEVAYYFLVNSEDTKRAVNAIHRKFFWKEKYGREMRRNRRKAVNI